MTSTRVLIVEDDPSSATTLLKLLEAEGCEIIKVTRSGEEAIAIARELPLDLVLMDIAIEGEIDGVEAAREIRRVADIPIVYITGYSDDETVKRATKTTPFAYILKPFNRKELSITVQMALYRNRVDRRFKENELQLSTILSSLPSAVIKTDADGIVEYMNPVAEMFISKSFERSKGMAVREVLELRDIESGEVIDNPGLYFFTESRTPALFKTLMLHSGDEKRIIEPWATAIHAPTGQVQSYVLALRDVTAQHEAEQNQRTMAAALESLEDAVVITSAGFDGDGPIIQYANESFERITGWSVADAQGERLRILRSSKDPSTSWEEMKRELSQGHLFHGEVTLQSKQGKEFLAQWSGNVVRNAFGSVSHLVFSIRDVTHVRRLEENIRQSQKIEAVGRLAGGIAHDFNNLLSVINSYSDLQILKLDESSPALKYARQIRAAGRKGTELVAQLMTFSRREKPNPSALALDSVVEEVKGMLRRVIREDIELVTHYDENIAPVKADQGQIEQVLLNLCVNARDAMPDGGTISIRIENRDCKEPLACGREWLRPGRYVALGVTDTGCGMDEELQTHIFDPFFTTKDIGKGTGLGLATVYSIVKQANAMIRVISEVGKGATFEILFPAQLGAAEHRENEDDPVEAPQGNEKILVVEDDETFLDCISGLLSLHGYEVHTAADGAQAVEVMDRIGYDLNLLVSDLVLPKMSGREVAARLLGKNPRVKVIFMTGYDDQLDSFYSLPGDSIVLEKPFPLSNLLVRVRELLDSQAASTGESEEDTAGG